MRDHGRGDRYTRRPRWRTGHDAFQGKRGKCPNRPPQSQSTHYDRHVHPIFPAFRGLWLHSTSWLFHFRCYFVALLDKSELLSSYVMTLEDGLGKLRGARVDCIKSVICERRLSSILLEGPRSVMLELMLMAYGSAPVHSGLTEAHLAESWDRKFHDES